MVFFASFVCIRLTSLAMNCSTGAFPSTTQHPILAQNFLDTLIIIYFQQIVSVSYPFFRPLHP